MEKAGGAMSRSSYIKDNNKKSVRDLASREEEYKKLNAELEAKTASLIQEADKVMKEQDSLLSKPSLLDNINTEDFLKDLEYDEEEDAHDQGAVSHSKLPTQQKQIRNNTKPPSRPNSTVSTGRPNSTASTGRVNSSRAAQPQRKTKGPRSAKSCADAAEDVAVPDETFLTELGEYSLQNTISTMEGRDESELYTEEEDVMPAAAADMGSEAQLRFLKAKLRVMQEELDKLAQDCSKKEEENQKLVAKMKELDEEKGRLTRSNVAMTNQIDKFKKLAEDAKGKADSLETQLSGTRKELESMKRTQKQQVSSHSATEVRLNRALEEVEKYKSQLQQAKTNSKDSSEQEKRKVEQLLSENRRLEKQKNELMAGFKKQLKLIDILKRQKMHVEAAKMLSFSEEEFVKALEWGS